MAPAQLMFLLMNVDHYIFTFDNVLLLVTDRSIPLKNLRGHGSQGLSENEMK